MSLLLNDVVPLRAGTALGQLAEDDAGEHEHAAQKLAAVEHLLQKQPGGDGGNAAFQAHNERGHRW